MADEPLRLGIVGANPNLGWAPRTHLPALLALPEYELTAVCTTKQESAEASAQKYEARKAYWNYRDLVADPEIDVVDVCVRVPYHHEIVMAALEAGKHVYCEWPLGASLAQAAEMADLAAARGLRTMVGLQARAAPSIARLRELVADGWIGRVHSAVMTQLQPGLLQARSADATWRADKTNGAHTLSISAGHALDAFCWCVGPFEEVSAIVDTLAPEWPLEEGGTLRATAPDYVSLTGRLVGGAVAQVAVASVPAHGSGFRMEVYGAEGTLVATAGSQVQATGVRVQGARQADSQLADIDIPDRLRWIPDTVPSGTPINVAQMMRRFANGIRNGEQPQPTFADAVRNHRLLDAIERSSERHAAVRLDRS
jgi:predicted dehydrogenase